jgi:MoaA/NifB/PqqE/SkfB family radical SAM enzyme
MTDIVHAKRAGGHNAISRWARDLVPAVCDVSVTNLCQATCTFCNFAHDKHIVTDRRFIDKDKFIAALPILYRRGVRYVNFQGGEPLLHPSIFEMTAAIAQNDMRPAMISNGWLLPEKIERMIDAGLSSLLFSLDSHDIAAHEKNRGLKGVVERLKTAVAIAKKAGLPTVAVVTVSHLVDFAKMPEILNYVGCDAVSFSYPRKEPFGSSSLVYNPDSDLVDFTGPQLQEAIDGIVALKKHFTVMNPAASLEDLRRFACGETQKISCVGGKRYYYLDWNLLLWRCENWHEPMGSVLDLDRLPDYSDHCTACNQNCYRDTSALMHFGVAVSEALQEAAMGHFGQAFVKFKQPGLGSSIKAVIEDAAIIKKLAPRKPKRSRASHNGPLKSARRTA